MDEDSTQSEKLAPQASKPVPDKDNTVPGNPDEAVLAGWEKHDAGGTGDCFYRAFCTATHAQENPGKTLKEEDLKHLAADARARVVLHVRKHIDRFREHYALRCALSSLWRTRLKSRCITTPTLYVGLWFGHSGLRRNPNHCLEAKKWHLGTLHHRWQVFQGRESDGKKERYPYRYDPQ